MVRGPGGKGQREGEGDAATEAEARLIPGHAVRRAGGLRKLEKWRKPILPWSPLPSTLYFSPLHPEERE